MAPKRIKVKPGKTQSKMGFIVGILFVILGAISKPPYKILSTTSFSLIHSESVQL